tara:strand:+ start:2061 stop:2252 length:192 start_codon:yes stop_codon:yes gene_type:complete
VNLKEMFPEGRWNADQTAYLVRKGRYDWHAAELKDGNLTITDFGRRVAKEVQHRPILRRRGKE